MDNSSHPLLDLPLVYYKAKDLFKSQYVDWKTLQIRDQIASTIANNIVFGIAQEEEFHILN